MKIDEAVNDARRAQRELEQVPVARRMAVARRFSRLAYQHQSMQNVLQLSMKIKVTYLHMRGIEFHHYWNYVRMFEDRVRTPDGPQHETDAYSGDSW